MFDNHIRAEIFMRWLVNETEFSNLTSDHEVLESLHGVPKVFRMPDDRIVKLFNTRRHPSSQWLYPCSVRFCRNARRLRQLEFCAPVVQRVFYRLHTRQHGVVYQMLPGTNFLGRAPNATLRKRLAQFVAELHAKGVYFRALHMGNIIAMPNSRLGLIDIDNTKFFGAPLSASHRARNFRQLFRSNRLARTFSNNDIDTFILDYIQATQSLDTTYSDLADVITRSIPQLSRQA